MITIHKPEDFPKMHAAGRLAAQILDQMYEFVKPGITTEEIDLECKRMVEEAGAKSATVGYRGYQWYCCTSVNHVVCHGIPSKDVILRDGDILNIDVTVIVDGWYGDTSRMYAVGKKISPVAKNLMKVTYESLMRAIDVVKPGNTIGDIGHAIQQYVESYGYSVVRGYCAHGLGRVFHADPMINHHGNPGEGEILKPGMFFTIEPMINAGAAGTRLNKSDGWTVTTVDRSLSAQFEHSMGVTETGVEIFTLSPKGLHFPSL